MSMTTQQSILIGFVAAGCLIGGGMYLGMSSGRSGAPQDPSSAQSASLRNTDRSGPFSQQEVRRIEQPPPAKSADMAQVTADAKKAVEGLRPTLVKKCWEPGGASTGTWKAMINITFDATGLQLASGLEVDRSSTRHEVTECVNGALPSLRIPPPGVVAKTEVPLSFP